MPALPLAARVALWVGASWAGRTPLETALAHAHAGVDEVLGDLSQTLGRWRSAGESAVLVAFPRPGGLAGMPRTPADALAAALTAGQCVVAPAVGGALVPSEEVFGPPGDRGTAVRWAAYEGEPLPAHVVDAINVGQLATSLAEAVHRATQELTVLGGTPWREGAAPSADRIATCAARGTLPAGLPPRTLHLVDRAAALRVLALDGLAVEQDAASLDAATSAQRATVLRRLVAHADETLAAAVSAAALTLAGRRPG